MYATLLRVAIAALFALAPLVAQDQASFEKDLEQLHKYMEQGRWDKAEDSLKELTTEHARASYVLTQRELLMEDARRIAFWKTVSPPALEDLVHGELESWKPGTKPKIELLYTTEESLQDFSAGRYSFLHPLVFTGSYEIEIEGKSYPWGKPPYLTLCIDGETSYLAWIGIPPDGRNSYYPARLYRRLGDDEVELDKLDSIPIKAGKEFVVQIKVTEAKISVKLNKKEILSAKRERDDAMGQIAISRAMLSNGFDSIRISGQVNSSWSGNLIDAAMQDEREAFEEEYDPNQLLPGWLLDAEVASVDSLALRAFPAPQPSRAHKAWSQVPLGIQQGKAAESLEWLLALEDYAIPATHRAFLACLLHQELGDAEAALRACREVLEGDHLFLPARLIEAWLVERRDRASAMQLLESIAKDFPNTPQAVQPYVQLLLLEERLPEAQRWVDQFSRRFASSPALALVRSMLVKAEKGPVFSDPTSYRTEHYEVVTDMDRELCIEAAQQLERMYRAYKLYLHKVPDEKKGRFQVYLFSGEAGFNRYAEDVLGGGHTNAAGLYSPVVKQLLIWNLSDHAELFRTVQHEGFHQYLDRVMPDPPVWFNEGMASYFELAGFEDGKWKEGQVDRIMLNRLNQQGLAPLRVFVRMGNTAFRNESFEARNYAQGWLFVHFLRNTSKANKELFETLFETLCETPSAEDALDSVFADLDFVQLEAALLDHLRELSQD